MIKQPLTDERIVRVMYSLQKMSILSQILLFENQNELDVDFRVPYLNNFAKRIQSDSKTIWEHLRKSGRMVVKTVNNDFYEDYSGEIMRVFNLLCGLDIEIVKEFANNLEKEVENII